MRHLKTVREALAVLGLEENAHPEEIRRRYRMLMHSFHPDSAGDVKDVSFFEEQTRRINEAYRLLKSSGRVRDGRNVKDPHIRRNEAAYCSRRIYMEEDLYGDAVLIDTGLYGRYWWDPETESFQMLLKSVSEAARKVMEDLLEKTQRGNTEKPDPGPLPGQRLQAKLLHLLLQEYIDPLLCLEVLPFCREDKDSKTAEEEGLSRCWQIRCHLRQVSCRENDLFAVGKKGGSVKQNLMFTDMGCLQIKASDNRLLAFHEDGAKAGQITFNENELYYIITPLILQGAAGAVFEGTHVQHGTVSGRLLLKVLPGKWKDPTAKINREIERTLYQEKEARE